ncbi:MAG: hypothetical protein ACFFEY_13365 [Candidatus Thorarchaeota archaeon]
MLFNSEGYFCEGEVEKDWQFRMYFGRIIVTNQDLLLLKKTKINLIEINIEIKNANEGYKIPFLKINKAQSVKKGKIYSILIETTDGYLFSITFAEYRKSGKRKCLELTELINKNILKSF